MQKLKQHIVLSFFATLLVACLFAPSVLKLAHIFEHHKHVKCIGGDTTHIHNIDLDCEFYKFQLNAHFLIPNHNNDWFYVTHQYQIPLVTYKFLNNHRQLPFSLRGPPVLV